jgi:hypothetical protein
MCLLLPGCYAADYTRRNLGLPAWYMALRAPLTLAATFGMLLTATRCAGRAAVARRTFVLKDHELAHAARTAELR